MNQVQIALAVPAVPGTIGQLSPTTAEPEAAPSLLPAPSSVCAGDALAGLLALASENRRVGSSRVIENINSLRHEQRAEWENQKAAILAAAQAQEDSGFWDSVADVCGAIAKVAGVVAAVAVAVGTGGAGVPLVLAVAGACLSAAAVVQSKFDVLQELGVDAEVAQWIEVGASVASLACTGGAALAGGAQSVTQFQKAVSVAGKVTAGAGSAAQAAQGVAIIEKGEADGETLECHADALRANVEATRAEQMLLRILDDLEESEKSYRRTVSVLKGSMDIQDNTLLLAAGRN